MLCNISSDSDSCQLKGAAYLPTVRSGCLYGIRGQIRDQNVELQIIEVLTLYSPPEFR